MRKLKVYDQIIGKKFGRLVALKIDEEWKGRGSKFVCRCECGNIKSVLMKSLRSGATSSCGCLYLETRSKSNKKHGWTKTPTYIAWHGAKSRCTNVNHHKYKDYGGRGISMCERWINSFENFLEDMGRRPDGMSIDRIDVNGNYEPENCRWATMKTQGRNRRTNRIIIVDGISATVSEVSEFFGITYQNLSHQIRNNGEDSICMYIKNHYKFIYDPLMFLWRNKKVVYKCTDMVGKPVEFMQPVNAVEVAA